MGNSERRWFDFRPRRIRFDSLIVGMVLAIFVVVIACHNSKSEEPVAVENPWVVSTAEDVEFYLGRTFGVPDDAENIEYRFSAHNDLAEMNFTWHGSEWTARMMPSTEMVDISGLYYDWDPEYTTHDSRQIGENLFVTRRAVKADEGYVVADLGFDEASQLMYTLSTTADEYPSETPFELVFCWLE